VPSKPVVVDGRTGTATIPDEGHAQPTEAAEPSDVILRVEGLKTHFPVYSSLLKRVVGHIRAVDGADFVLSAGETLSLVGESGCGKSTLGRTILRLVDATDGRVVYLGKEITGYGRRAMRPVRRDLQIVFQDPYASLNPRMMVRDIVGEPLRIHLGLRGKARQERVVELLRMVGLEPDYINRYPHEFSGGQRQRIGIARVLATNPKIVILDEPVSALDVSIQAQVVNLLMELQKELGIAYVFIAHDLSVVRHISNRVAVMYLGRIVEIGTKHDVFESPMHPYTQALLSAVPIPDPGQKGSRRRIVLTGDVPNPANPPSGCTFRTRCFRVQERCAEEIPSLVECPGADHRCSCFYPEPARLFS
jgi:oligopeptide/dipeptide ABC transporter ATP-binding protein